jgi:WD40 repeat protein
VISASDDKTLKLWDVNTGEHIRSFQGHNSEVWSVSVTPDGERIVSLANGSRVIVWELHSGEKLHTLSLYPPYYLSYHHTQLFHNGTQFFYSGALFDCETGAELLKLPEEVGSVMVILPGEERVVAAGGGTPLTVWDIAQETEIGELSHSNVVFDAALLPDERIISVSYDALVRIWDIRNCALLHELRGHRGRINAVAVSADGNLAASASGDHDLKIWDLQDFHEVATFSAESPLFSCALTPDGSIAVVGDQLGSIHFLKLEKAGAISDNCG